MYGWEPRKTAFGAAIVYPFRKILRRNNLIRASLTLAPLPGHKRAFFPENSTHLSDHLIGSSL